MNRDFGELPPGFDPEKDTQLIVNAKYFINLERQIKDSLPQRPWEIARLLTEGVLNDDVLRIYGGLDELITSQDLETLVRIGIEAAKPLTEIRFLIDERPNSLINFRMIQGGFHEEWRIRAPAVRLDNPPFFSVRKDLIWPITGMICYPRAVILPMSGFVPKDSRPPHQASRLLGPDYVSAFVTFFDHAWKQATELDTPTLQ